MAKSSALSLDQLKRAVQIHEEIESLQAELAGLLSGSSPSGSGAKRGRKPGPAKVVEGDQPKATRKKGAKRTMSPEAREKIAAAQRRRWAKQKKAVKE